MTDLVTATITFTGPELASVVGGAVMAGLFLGMWLFCERDAE